ncbi:MAG: hypothetical protein P1S60_20445, partial [Anaerolineae bacterium]|nr:hypothetical protein [Anaerolineae bacterium]
MKRWLPLLTIITLACVVPSYPIATPKITAVSTDPVSGTAPIVTTPPTVPTFTPTPHMTPVSIITQDLSLHEQDIHIYPMPLYPNDSYSVDVVPHIPEAFTGTLTVTVSLPHGVTLEQKLEPSGLDAKPRASFLWVGNVPTATTDFSITTELINAQIQSIHSVTKAISILPFDGMFPPEPDARWAITQTLGYRIHYLTGSGAERDLGTLIVKARDAYDEITGYLGMYRESVDIYVLDRVIGQGGYA